MLCELAGNWMVEWIFYHWLGAKKMKASPNPVRQRKIQRTLSTGWRPCSAIYLPTNIDPSHPLSSSVVYIHFQFLLQSVKGCLFKITFDMVFYHLKEYTIFCSMFRCFSYTFIPGIISSKLPCFCWPCVPNCKLMFDFWSSTWVFKANFGGFQS